MAFIWGAAEATFFFVVPDVLLTFIAQRRGFRAAAIAVGFTVLGASIGGLAMWRLGARYPGEVARFLDALPAISPGMIDGAGAALSGEPLRALIAGSFSGVPYKVFASEAPGAGLSAPAFLVMSIPARALRFALVVVATAIGDRIAANWWSPRARTGILVGGWVVFYAIFWSVLPN